MKVVVEEEVNATYLGDLVIRQLGHWNVPFCLAIDVPGVDHLQVLVRLLSALHQRIRLSKAESCNWLAWGGKKEKYGSCTFHHSHGADVPLGFPLPKHDPHKGAGNNGFELRIIKALGQGSPPDSAPVDVVNGDRGLCLGGAFGGSGGGGDGLPGGNLDGGLDLSRRGGGVLGDCGSGGGSQGSLLLGGGSFLGSRRGSRTLASGDDGGKGRLEMLASL
jgi:hypothetical protein